MDTVKGARGSKKVLLTLIFRNTNFMLIFLMPDGTQESVLAVFDMLTNRLGVDTFRRLFPVILTDNGVEFKNPHELEFTKNGTRRTRLFYCDPQASWQKAHLYVVGKGKTVPPSRNSPENRHQYLNSDML